MSDLSEWFKDRPIWLQDAARRLVQNGAIRASDLDDLVTLCKQELGEAANIKEKAGLEPIPKHAFKPVDRQIPLRINAIEDVIGINALAPRKPLEFGPEPLTIVYGTNGSGKSGYLRILKQVCGARAAGELHGNVFEASPKEKSCTLQYKVKDKEHRVKWTPSVGFINDLEGVAI